MKKYKKISMEFKITVNRIDQREDNTKEYVKARLEDTIKRSSFQWGDTSIISNLDGYHNAYLEGLDKGEQIFNKVINKNE